MFIYKLKNLQIIIINMSVKLIVDNRESIKEQIANIIPNTSFENLILGDYLFTIDDKNILVIERKTIADYASSIADGRNREQKKRLISNYPINQIIYLVEGDLTQNNSNYTFNKISKETIVSSIMNTILRDNIQVFHTIDMKETIELLHMIYTKFQKQGLTFLSNKSCYKDDLIMTKQCKKDNISKEMCFQMMLNCIPNVSTKISTRIVEKYSTFHLFYNELSKLSSNEEREKLIVDIKTNSNDKERKIPKTTAKNIVEFIGF